MRNFLTPGPINISDMQKKLMGMDVPYFAGEEYGRILQSIEEPLRNIFKTGNPVLIGTGSGTMAMEAVLTNFLHRRDAIVVITAGKYGDNWVQMASAYHSMVVLEVQYPDPMWETKLDKILHGYNVKAVFMTHCETTTATELPISKIAELTKTINPDVLTVVDAISSLAVAPLNSAEFDIVISSSQKGLQSPAGFFFLTMNPFAYNVAWNTNRRSFYFDVVTEMDRYHNRETSHTPAGQLMYALQHAVVNIGCRAGGVDRIIEHCKMLRNIVLYELRRVGIPIKAWCPVCTAIPTDKQKEIMDIMARDNWYVGGGVRKDAGKLIRIMHFGWWTTEEFIYKGTEVFINAYKEAHCKNS